MSSKYLPDGLIEIQTPAGSMTFEKTFASLAWPEDSSGRLLVIGVKSDGRLNVLSEGSGGLFELGSLALQAKKDYLIDSIIVDDRDSVSTIGMRNLEGLCYDTRNKTSGMAVNRHGARSSGSAWARDALAVSPASREILHNYRGALERTRILIMSRRIIIDEDECPTLAHELTQPLDFVLNSAVVKALVLASGMISFSADPEPVDDRVATRWYANRPRRNTS